MKLSRPLLAALVCVSAPVAAAPFQIATAPGSGSPLVKTFDHASASMSFLASDSAVSGGARIALGDVNGDGVPDILTATGTSSLVNVFSGADLSTLHSFFAFGETWNKGLFIASGDLNGDGRDDIIASAAGGDLPIVAAWSGSDLTPIRNFFPYAAGGGGVRVAAGDINADGKDDIITAPGNETGGQIRVWSGATGQELYSFYSYSAFTGGVFVAAGDIDGDGVDDIVTAPDAGAAPQVKVFSGADARLLMSFLAYAPSMTGGVRVAVGDVNGDGRADIVTAPGPGYAPQVQVFSGNDLSLLSSFLAYDSAFRGGVFVAAIPEPTGSILLMATLAGLLLRRRPFPG